jgi:hypothetical protein
MISPILITDYLLFGVALLLAWEWWRSSASKQFSASLVVASVSCAWILLATVWPGAIGPDYSRLHGVIVLANLIAAVATAIATLAIRSQRSVRVFIPAVALAIGWFIALAVMDAV